MPLLWDFAFLLGSGAKLKKRREATISMKRQRRNVGIILASVFLVFLMVTSIAGFIFGSGNGQPTVRHKGIKFAFDGSRWTATIDRQQHSFSYTPKDVTFVALPGIDVSQVMQVDITSDYNATVNESIAFAAFELSEALSKKGLYARQGFTAENQIGYPVITCATATQYAPVIYFREASVNSTRIVLKENCIIIESENANNLLPYADALAFQFMGLLS